MSWAKDLFGAGKSKKKGRILFHKNTAVYHATSRTAYHEFRFSAKDKSMLRNMLERQAAFCGVEVLAFCILDNHFHLLARIPYQKTPPNDKELIKRYASLYAGQPVPKNALTVDELKAILETGGANAKLVRKQLHARMMSLPVFIKELKQRFSIWYNHQHNNTGTLWAERFKSVLVEDVSNVLKLIAAYIDLNPVRAGICENPESYPFSSIGEAYSGNAFARKGLMSIYLSKHWHSVQKKHLYLLSNDQPLRPDKSLQSNDVYDILGTGLRTPIGMLLRNKLPTFSQGGVLGSSKFVEQVEAFLNKRASTKKRFNPKPLYETQQSSCKFHSLYMLPIPLTY